MDLLVVGTSHEVAPAAVRDTVALTAEGVVRALDALAATPDVSECAVLATCTRTEVYLRSPDAGRGAAAAWGAVARAADAEAPDESHRYVRSGQGAAEHLFRVAAGIDSVIVGEHQVLGQVRDALAIAEARGTTGARLSRLFQAAVRTGRRARNETTIGLGPVSVPCAGVRLARRLLGGLEQRSAVVVGAGRTGASVCRFLARRPLGELTVVNRTAAAAHELARVFGGRGAGLDALAEAVSTADVVLTATHASAPVLTRATLEPIMASRPLRPLLLVDLSSPRNVDPSAAELEGVTVRDLDHLGEIVDENLVARATQIPLVEAIVAEEAERFVRWYERLERPQRKRAAPPAAGLRDSGAA